MICFRPYRVDDLGHYLDRAIEVAARPFFKAPEAELLAGWTLEQDGLPIGSGGMTEARPGVAYCWAVMTPMPRALVLTAHRKAWMELQGSSWQRIEAHVGWDFESSHRWVRLLGFKPDPERPFMFGPDRPYMRYVFGA